MLSPRSITILALVATAAAHPFQPPAPVIRTPVTSLSRSELEDVQPWIKFPLFGNVLESLPNFLPTIPEAGPKIENDSKKFQVIINVKEYKKEFLKVKEKGSFIIIQGAHADVHDAQSSIDSQFIQTYTLPVKAIASSVTATLTSDGFLVVTAPIGSAINKVTYNEKEIPVIESEIPLLEEKIEDKDVVSSTSTSAPLILVTPSAELLPPNPINNEVANVAYITPDIPSISLLPPKQINEESIPAVSPGLPTAELLPPKQSDDGDVNVPIVIPVSSGQIETNAASNTNNANAEKNVKENIINIPLQQLSEGQQIIIGPTQAPFTNIQDYLQLIQTDGPIQSGENVDIPTTQIISLFDEPVRGYVKMTQPEQEGATTEESSLNANNDIGTSAPLQEQDNKLEDIKEKSETFQLRNEGFDDFTTESSSLQELGPAVSALRSDIVLELESFTGEPEIIQDEERLNEESSIKSLLSPENLSEITTEDTIAATTNQQALLHKDDESELIIESSTASLVRSDLNPNEEINGSPTEINNIPPEFARSEEIQNLIGDENVLEDSTLSGNLPSLDVVEVTEKTVAGESLASIANVVYDKDIVEVTEKTITGESLASIANVVYNENLLKNITQTEVKESELILSEENSTSEAVEVSKN